MGMLKILMPAGVLIAGLGAGAGAAVVAVQVAGPAKPAAAHAAKEEKTEFVPVPHVIAPLVFADGRLSGYVAFDVQLEVAADKVESTTARLPLLLDAITMRTYRTPMAAGPDGMLPDVATFRDVVKTAAAQSLGPDLVRKVAVTKAVAA